MGEFRSEERLMAEQALLQEERKALLELKAEMDREKAGREAKLRVAALAQAGQSQSHAEIMARNPLRANAVGNQGSNIQLSHEMGEQGRNINPDEMMNGWGNNSQREEKEPSEDFLNEKGETGEQENWLVKWYFYYVNPEKRLRFKFQNGSTFTTSQTMEIAM
ncbi:hypothetical protein N665_0106s0042 [Sinapis alba]|nr:hypothetical protein N665_0106s0042 [Sinapis alba]